MNSGGPLPSSSTRVTCDTCGDRCLLIITHVSIYSATHYVLHCGPRPQHGPHVTHCRTNLISSSLPQSFRLLRHNRHNRLIRHNRPHGKILVGYSRSSTSLLLILKSSILLPSMVKSMVESLLVESHADAFKRSAAQFAVK